MQNKKYPYQIFKQAMSEATDSTFIERKKIISVRGDCDFLCTLAIRKLRKLWIDAGWSVDKLDGVQVTADRFLQLSSSTSLFEPKNLTFIYDIHNSPEYSAILKDLASNPPSNSIIFIQRTKDQSQKASKELQKLRSFEILCDNPMPWEVKEFVRERTKEYQLSLTPDAIDFLIEVTGLDLYRLENELARLSYNYSGKKSSLGSAELMELLSFIREDNLFKIDQYLCQEAFLKVHGLIASLLERGESPLGILAVLATHCRKSLQIIAGIQQGTSPQEIARSLRIPPTALQSYIPYLQRRNKSTFLNALKLCHDADRRLKSRSFGEEVIFSYIVQTLAQRRHTSEQTNSLLR